MESGFTECYPITMKRTILETMNNRGILGSCNTLTTKKI